MRLSEKTNAFIVGHITFPLTNYLFNRKNILSRYNNICQSERDEPERIRALQLGKLKEIIKYAHERVPFYADRFRSIGLEPGDITSLEDIKRIPPIGRQELIDCRCAMVDSALAGSAAFADRSKRAPGEPVPFAPFRRHRLVRNTSSGSTGAPTVFYEDGSRTALNWVHEMRLKSWFGIPPGAREARMVRLSTEYLPDSRTIRLRNRLWNQLVLPGVNLADEEYAVCVQKLKVFRPKTLWGFTSALTGLAEYLLRNGIDSSPWGIKAVVGWAAPVYDHERKILEEAFSCPVSNIYGAREVGHVAGQCPAGMFHINAEHLYIEHETPPGSGGDEDTGEILATTLDVSPMPFIRYRMGDVGRVAASDCGCGRTLPVLKDFLGRTGEIFRTKDGRMISPNFWCRTFMNVKVAGAIKRFQVIYLSDSSMKIKIVKNKNYTEATNQALKDHLKTNFAEDMAIEFVYVSEIPPKISGKYQMVVNQTGQTEER